jgi:succinylarginine dihydrolase
MRMGTSHAAKGLEIFVYGRSGGAFPARQHEQASRAVARLHGLDPATTLFVEQNPDAIAAGAFHNDVVAVANERVLFTHELAFADPERTYAAIRARLPEAEIVVVPDSAVSLADAIKSYLFNAQLLTLPSGEQALVLPLEGWEHPRVRAWLDGMLASNGPIRKLLPVDVRQSMANGGGPACLRLRVVADPATVDSRFLLNEAKLARLEAVVAAHWPEQIDPADLGSDSLAHSVIAARAALLAELALSELA